MRSWRDPPYACRQTLVSPLFMEQTPKKKKLGQYGKKKQFLYLLWLLFICRQHEASMHVFVFFCFLPLLSILVFLKKCPKVYTDRVVIFYLFFSLKASTHCLFGRCRKKVSGIMIHQHIFPLCDCPSQIRAQRSGYRFCTNWSKYFFFCTVICSICE